MNAFSKLEHENKEIQFVKEEHVAKLHLGYCVNAS